MQANRAHDTQIEVMLAKELWRRGYRYRKNLRSIPGTPDICFKSHKVAVFCDGEFWHGYNWAQSQKNIKSNQDYWIKKIERNRQRDQQVNQQLQDMGWIVMRFWESTIRKNLGECADQIEAVLRERKIESLHNTYQNSNRFYLEYEALDIAAEPEITYGKD